MSIIQNMLKESQTARAEGRAPQPSRCRKMLVRYLGEEFAVRVCYTEEQIAQVTSAYPDGVIDVAAMLEQPRTGASRRDRFQLVRYARDAYIGRAKDDDDRRRRFRATAETTALLNAERARRVEAKRQKEARSDSQ